MTHMCLKYITLVCLQWERSLWRGSIITTIIILIIVVIIILIKIQKAKLEKLFRPLRRRENHCAFGQKEVNKDRKIK